MKLTLPQQDIYFEQLYYPNEPIHNIGAKISIRGAVSVPLLNEAYVALINQHDAFRSTFRKGSDIEVPEVAIAKRHTTLLQFIDFSGEEGADVKANDFMQQNFRQPFNFDDEELLHRFILIKVEKDFHYLFSVYHHVITDGWGTSLMFQRLVRNYNELVEHSKIISVYPYSYQDFAIDDSQYMASEQFERDKQYWKEKFKTRPDHLFSKIKPVKNLSRRKEFIISRPTYNKLTEVAQTCNSTTFHAILAILYLYFSRKQRNSHFAVGIPVLNRSKHSHKNTVGLFMGVSALQIEVDFEEKFTDLILKIRQQLRKDYRHQRFPLGKLIKELGVYGGNDRLFDITLSYEKQNYAEHFHNTDTQVIPLTHQSERVPLAIYIREFDDTKAVKIDFDYNLSYLDEPAVSEVVLHFEELLNAVIHDSQKKLSEYQFLSEAEKQMLLKDFNNTTYEYPRDKTLIDFFHGQVDEYPHKIAVRDQYSAYTYEELRSASDHIADFLIEKYGVADKTPVAVLMDRSAALIVVLLGIMKAGRAYIPLDPEFPADRLGFIIENSQVSCILGDLGLSQDIEQRKGFINVSQVMNDRLTVYSRQTSNVHGRDSAYIIYTSGSTGNPKGVVIRHQSLLNFLLSIARTPGIDKHDVLYSVTTQSFDISILEFFLPLMAGATVYVARKEVLQSPVSLKEELSTVRPSIIQATPSFYQMLFNAGWTGDRKLKVLCGGDTLNEMLAERLLEQTRELWNMYGPTETTIWSGIKKINKPEEANNIGSPINNTGFYILDECRQLLPVGSLGNIFISGDGLAQEYLGNENLTAERFINSPFEPSVKLYNTGDVGRWNRNGEIEFFGRNDFQVKIRGYRIELGEIETHLTNISTIQSAAVLAKASNDNQLFLVAYLQIEQEDFDEVAIKEVLQNGLPEYMVPQVLVPLESFPLTPNQKVDRKALFNMALGELLPESFEKPQTRLQSQLCKFYKEVLEMDSEVSINSSFFTLGGHSLSAVKLISRIEKELAYAVSLRTIFDHPSVKLLSTHIENSEVQVISQIPKSTIQGHIPLTDSQYEIWLASQTPGKSIAYNMNAAFKILGKVEPDVLQKTFLSLIDKYEILRVNFVEIDGLPHQQYHPVSAINLNIDCYEVHDHQLDDKIDQYIHREFDLEQDLLIRVAIFRTKNFPVLVFSTHHTVMDGWSLEVLVEEISKTYTSILHKQETVENLRIQFKDYALWHNQREASETVQKQAFWEQYLKHYRWQPLIPDDLAPGEPNDEPDGATHSFEWDEQLFPELLNLAQEHQVTLHTLLVASFNVLLHKMYHHEDICLGTVNSGREVSELHSHMGMFVKTLPLRSKIDAESSFVEVLKSTHDNLMQMDLHQDIPAGIRNKLRPEVLITLQNPSFDFENLAISSGLSLVSYPVPVRYSRLPILIIFQQNKNTLTGTIHYNTKRYEAATIAVLENKYNLLMDELSKRCDTPLNEIDIQLDFEKEHMLDIDFNF